jgi:MFS family permease
MVSEFFPPFCFSLRSLPPSLLLFHALTPSPPSPNLSQLNSTQGIGSALLFVTYGAAQLPIAALSSRVGLVRTLGCACFLWGVVAASFAAVNSVGSFYACRLALGLAEAPTFPLIITILRSFHASDGAVRRRGYRCFTSSFFSRLLISERKTFKKNLSLKNKRSAPRTPTSTRQRSSPA